MQFNLAEKLAIVKVIDEMIFADGEVDQKEIDYLIHLSEVLEFDLTLVQEARLLNPAESLSILSRMSDLKKHALAIMMLEMAKSDGQVDQSEMELIATIFTLAGINLEEILETKPEIDLSDVYFVSSDHIRYQNGQRVSGPHGYGGPKRAIKIESDIQGQDGYTVTLYNLDGDHPVWGNNVQMAPKPMKVISSTDSQIVLRGYGEDPRAMGHPDGRFDHYGATVFHDNTKIIKIIMHMHDRNVDIEYLV